MVLMSQYSHYGFVQEKQYRTIYFAIPLIIYSVLTENNLYFLTNNLLFVISKKPLVCIYKVQYTKEYDGHEALIEKFV